MTPLLVLSALSLVCALVASICERRASRRPRDTHDPLEDMPRILLESDERQRDELVKRAWEQRYR